MTQETQQQQRERDALIIQQLSEIKQQNAEVLIKLDEREKQAIKSGAVAGAVAGAASGGLIAVGMEFIRAKLGF